MRPAWWKRAAAVTLSVWFVLLSLQLPVLHVCAVHAPSHGAALRAGPPAAGPNAAGTRTHERPHEPVAHQPVAHQPVAHQAGSACASPAATGDGPATSGHLCSCVGSCCGAAVGTAPAPAELAFGTPALATPVAPGRPAYDYVAAWTDFVLPFSTAPPVARLA